MREELSEATIRTQEHYAKLVANEVSGGGFEISAPQILQEEDQYDLKNNVPPTGRSVFTSAQLKRIGAVH